MKTGIHPKANDSLIVKLLVVAQVIAFIWIAYVMITKF